MDAITSSVPSIHILSADDPSALFEDGDVFTADMNQLLREAGLYTCSQDIHTSFLPNSMLNAPPELEEISELSHLNTTVQPPLTGFSFSHPYSTIQAQENAPDHGFSPSLGSPIPSPTPSFCSSLSPSSFHEPLAYSDTESLLPASPISPDSPFWPSHPFHHSNSSHSSLIPIETFCPTHPSQSDFGPRRPRSTSSPPRHGPVASKAMLEANGRRRRHPAQYRCDECSQTFTALFSLKRHQQSHTGERRFVCSIPGCSQRFFNQSDCKRHEKSRKRHKDLLIA